MSVWRQLCLDASLSLLVLRPVVTLEVNALRSAHWQRGSRRCRETGRGFPHVMREAAQHTPCPPAQAIAPALRTKPAQLHRRVSTAELVVCHFDATLRRMDDQPSMKKKPLKLCQTLDVIQMSEKYLQRRRGREAVNSQWSALKAGADQ